MGEVRLFVYQRRIHEDNPLLDCIDDPEMRCSLVGTHVEAEARYKTPDGTFARVVRDDRNGLVGIVEQVRRLFPNTAICIVAGDNKHQLSIGKANLLGEIVPLEQQQYYHTLVLVHRTSSVNNN